MLFEKHKIGSFPREQLTGAWGRKRDQIYSATGKGEGKGFTRGKEQDHSGWSALRNSQRVKERGRSLQKKLGERRGRQGPL